MRALTGAAVVAALTLIASSASAQEPRPEAVRAKNAVRDCSTLGELIALVGERTGKVFLFAERVKGIRIHMEGGRAIPEAALYDVFKSILELNQLALATIARGTPSEVVKIFDARMMRSRGGESFGAEELRAGRAVLPSSEEVVTVTYSLRWSRARLVSNALRPLLDPNLGGQILGIDGAEVLVMSDFAPNIKRLLRVIELMDQPGEALEWEVITLSHANVRSLASDLAHFAQAQQRASQPAPERLQSQFIPFPPTNSLIVQATAEVMAEVKALVAKLDVQPVHVPDAPQVLNRVIVLKHADSRLVYNAVRGFFSSSRDGWVRNADARSLVVHATAARLAEIEPVIAALDVPSPEAEVAEAVVLKHGNAEALAAMINGLAPKAGVWVRARANANGTAVALAGRRRQVAQARGLLESLDVEPAAKKK